MTSPRKEEAQLEAALHAVMEKEQVTKDAPNQQQAVEALKQVGIDEEVFVRSPFELSGGQKRRVAVAGVIAMEPAVLILDEPTAGLDPEGRREILGMVSRLHKERNMTVILVSHSMDDVAEYADKIMVLNHGELAFFDTPKEVFRHRAELESFGLSAPEITYLAADLREAGFDIDPDISTIAEAKAEILRAVKERKR